MDESQKTRDAFEIKRELEGVRGMERRKKENSARSTHVYLQLGSGKITTRQQPEREKMADLDYWS